MEPVDMLIFSLAVIALACFAFGRFRYSNINAYHEKLKRLNELRKTIASLESDNREIDKAIESINADTVCDSELADEFINYFDNEDKLKHLKNEQRKIEAYLMIAGKYINWKNDGIS